RLARRTEEEAWTSQLTRHGLTPMLAPGICPRGCAHGSARDADGLALGPGTGRLWELRSFSGQFLRPPRWVSRHGSQPGVLPVLRVEGRLRRDRPDQVRGDGRHRGSTRKPEWRGLR